MLSTRTWLLSLLRHYIQGILANNAELTPKGVPEAKVMNNLDWFGPMGFLEFLREVRRCKLDPGLKANRFQNLIVKRMTVLST